VDNQNQTLFADDPILSTVARYWMAQRHGRPIPIRADIDPLHLPASVWPNLLLTEPVPGTTAMRYRLVGSAHVERYTFDFTGRTTAEIMQGSYRTYMEAIYTAALQYSAPVYSESVFRWDANGYAFTRRLMLPLRHRDTGGGDGADMVFTVQVWPSTLPYLPRSIADLSGSGGFRDGEYVVLDRDSFRPRGKSS